MKITEEHVLAAAKSDAKFDGYEFDGLGRAQRERYLERSRLSLNAAFASPAPSKWDGKLSDEAIRTLNYMKREAPRRGGFMFEGARPAFERGEYKDRDLSDLLAAGAIAPHPDPNKGWVVANAS